MKESLDNLLAGKHLSEDEADALLVKLAGQEISPLVTSAVVAALRTKGETPEEVRGLARALRRLARRPAISDAAPLVDVVGTGGDGSGSFNISTGVALLCAAMGHRVTKHGSRAASSKSGSADMLEELGLVLPLGPVDASRCLEATGFTFLFAPEYHPAMRAVAEVRKTLGVRTVFNILGPLVNPCEPEYNVIGAYGVEVARLMAHAISGLRIKRTYVIHGEPGWDEATPCGPFTVFDVTPGEVREETRDPADYGFGRCKPDDLAGGDAAENAAALKRVFEGERGAHRDALVLGAALVEEVTGRADSAEAARAAGERAIDEGHAREVLAGLARFSQESSRAS